MTITYRLNIKRVKLISFFFLIFHVMLTRLYNLHPIEPHLYTVKQGNVEPSSLFNHCVLVDLSVSMMMH